MQNDHLETDLYIPSHLTYFNQGYFGSLTLFTLSFLLNFPISPIPQGVSPGVTADKIQYRFQAFLKFPNNSTCGGSLIGRTWILTAAHCLHGQGSVAILLGGSRVTTFWQYTTYSTVFLPHPAFNATSQANDIALIKLTTLPQISALQYKPIEMVSSNIGNLDRQMVRASGYVPKPDHGYIIDSLGRVDLITIPNKDCETFIDKLYIQNTSICTSWVDKVDEAFCEGEDGGPLTMLYERKVILIGVLKRGDCVNFKPGVSTSVAQYRDWIEERINLYDNPSTGSGGRVNVMVSLMVLMSGGLYLVKGV